LHEEEAEDDDVAEGYELNAPASEINELEESLEAKKVNAIASNTIRSRLLTFGEKVLISAFVLGMILVTCIRRHKPEMFAPKLKAPGIQVRKEDNFDDDEQRFFTMANKIQSISEQVLYVLSLKKGKKYGQRKFEPLSTIPLDENYVYQAKGEKHSIPSDPQAIKTGNPKLLKENAEIRS
jgi:hypothetical protein